MDDERRKAKRLVTILFVLCLCTAFICFGVFVIIAVLYRGGDVNSRIITISQIIAMTGIFFLVLAFLYLLPILISHRKYERE